MPDTFDRLSTALRNSHLFRLFVVAVLALVLQIPVSMIGGLIGERESRSSAAASEVASKWGDAQSITGPALVVPYTHRVTDVENGRAVTRTETRTATFLAESLHLRGRLHTEMRHRGIFSIPVYTLVATVDGAFARPSFTSLGASDGDVDWSKARLAVGVSDPRAIQSATAVSWNGASVPFLPGSGDLVGARSGINAPVPLTAAASGFHFSFPITVNGSQSFDVAPFAQNTVVELTGDSPDPSFQGAWLPTTHAESADSFRARWSIPFLGRGYPQVVTMDSAVTKAIDASRFGVQIVDPVDGYHMAERSVKYAFLFIMLTFTVVWLIEVIGGLHVHPIQYLMLGAALCLFYLLELAFLEHIGFAIAYVVASVAVIGMCAGYARAVLGRLSRVAVVTAAVTSLYGYLYLLLMNEDYALLVGSVGLFVTLAIIMYVTRRIDWYGAAARHKDDAVYPTG